MSPAVIAKRGGKMFYGWWIVLAASIIQFYGAGVWFYGFSVFFKPMSTEFGWSRAATAGAFSLSRLEGGFEGPIVGWLIDRLGPRKLMVGGAFIAGLGFMSMYFINSIWIFYLLYAGLLSVGYNASFSHASLAAIANWFIKKRTRAISIYSLGAGLGGAVVVPTLAWLVANYGWRTAAVVVGLLMWVICIPLGMAFRHRPEQYGHLPDGAKEVPNTGGPLPEEKGHGREELQSARFGEIDFTLKEAMKAPSFWLLGLSNALRSIGQNAVVVHQIAYLTDVGISEQMAAAALGLLTLTSIPARLIFGWLGDRYSKRHLLMLTYILSAVGVLVLAYTSNMSQVYIFLVIYAIGYGGAIPIMMSIRGEYFGRKNFATIRGVMDIFQMLGTVIGPVFAGYVYDVSGSYYWAFMSFVVTYLLGAAVVLLAKRPTKAAAPAPTLAEVASSTERQ